MSTFPNAYGNALGQSIPSFAYSAVGMPFGTLLKPGSRVAAYVRSTGRQDLDDLQVSENLVASINEGAKRCRAGFDDAVMVLTGHTETHSVAGAIWPNLKAGTRIIGCGVPGSSNNPNITLAHVGASIALNVANVTLAGLNINSATAAVTGAIVVTAAGCSIVGNFISFTGALGANPGIAVTGAANFVMGGNHYVCNSTDPMVRITGAASTDFVISGNISRQAQATSGGAFATTANTAGISGMFAKNMHKTAVTSTAGAGVIVLGAATLTTVGNVENYACDETAAGALLVTGA